jgi:hypothetical protein
MKEDIVFVSFTGAVTIHNIFETVSNKQHIQPFAAATIRIVRQKANKELKFQRGLLSLGQINSFTALSANCVSPPFQAGE